MRVIRVFRRDMEQEITLNITVNQIPNHREEHNNYRHLALSLQQEGEDKRTLEIMEFKDQEENPIRRLLYDRRQRRITPGLEVLVQHHKKYRAFHQQPAGFVVHGRTPFLCSHLAVSGIHKIQ